MTPYTPTIGLEIHAELHTETKMFCRCKNDPDEKSPNAHVCPVCMAHPGALPTINKKAVEAVLKVGTALGSTLADFSEFDRKSYFYPDIPKGFQISQYKYPLVSGGALRGVAITRVHLEEDTARSQHEGGVSLVDFNRSGVPLMELVTEPVIHDAKTAGAFARELQLLLRTLGVSEANLDKGQMRIEANVSVSKDGVLGTKVEVKNLNSFKSVEDAIDYEIQRQSEALEKGEKLIQETRGFDESKRTTFHQRFKEGSADYRYFPEPDLPKMKLSEIDEWSESVLRAALPELPEMKRKRYQEAGLKEADADYFTSNTAYGNFFDAVIAENKNPDFVAKAANYLISDVAGIEAKSGISPFEKLSPTAFAEVITMIEEGALSSRGAKDLIALLASDGGDARSRASEKNLIQKNDAGAIQALVESVLSKNEKVVEEYKCGKESALQFLIGMCMRESKGSGNPDLIKAELLKMLQ